MARSQKEGNVNHHNVSSDSFNQVLGMLKSYPIAFESLMEQIFLIRELDMTLWVNDRELHNLPAFDILEGIGDVERCLGQAHELTRLAQKIQASPVWTDFPCYFEERDEVAEMQEALGVQMTLLSSNLRRLLDALSWAERFEEFDPTLNPRLWRAKGTRIKEAGRLNGKLIVFGEESLYCAGSGKRLVSHRKMMRRLAAEDLSQARPAGKKGPRFSSARKAREDQRDWLIDCLAA